MKSILGSIDCLLLILIVSDSCILTIVHTFYGLNQESRHLLPKSKSCVQMIAGMAETAFSHACCQVCNRDLHINIIDHYIYSCSYLGAERIRLWYNILQLNDNAYVHLMNLGSTYVTLVLLGLEDDATSLLLGGI